MGHVTIAKAKAHLGDLIARAEAGETILISRRGRPVVERRAIEQPRQPVDVAAPRAFIAGLPDTQAGTVEAMRDEARFRSGIWIHRSWSARWLGKRTGTRPSRGCHATRPNLR